MVGGKNLTWKIFLLLTIVAMMHVHKASGTDDGAPAPAPAMDCTSALLGMADCLSYVEEGSNVSKPDKGCCSGLKKVVKEEVSCLCEAFSSSQNFGVSLNMTKALALPSACKVKTPPFSKCNISVPGGMGEAPAPSPFTGDLYPITDDGGKSPAPAPAPAAHSAASVFTASSNHLIATVLASLLAYYVL